jgi:hypothetical protein
MGWCYDHEGLGFFSLGIRLRVCILSRFWSFSACTFSLHSMVIWWATFFATVLLV